MSVKGFRLEDSSVARYDYRFLDNIFTDTSLSIYGAAADAKAVGDRINALAHVPTSDNATLANESLVARSIDINNIDLSNVTPNSPIMEYISNILITPEKIKEQLSKVDYIDLNSDFMDYLENNLIVATAITAERAIVSDLATTALKAEKADIATLATQSLTAQSIDANNIDVTNLTTDSALINSLNTKLLVANAINAQTADVARFATESLTAQSIDANNIITDNLDADSAFIKFLETNLITTGEIDVNDLKAKLATINVLEADSAFVGYLSGLSADIARQTVNIQYVTDIVAKNMTLSNLQAGDIVLKNNMRILSEEDATEGMIMSGSEIQFLDGDGNVSISIGYNTIDDGFGGTTVDYDHPAIIIKDENGSVMLNSTGLAPTDVGLAPMIQNNSIDKGKLSFDFIKTESGDIIVSNYNGDGSTWGRAITEFINDMSDSLEIPYPIDVDIYYINSDSNLSVSDIGWDTNAPSWLQNRYVWQQIKTTYNNSAITYTDPVCIQSTGNRYTSIVEQYYKSTSDSIQIDGEWTIIKPTWEDGYYIWARSEITWDTDEITYSEPILATPNQSIYSSTINILNNIAKQDSQGKWSLSNDIMSNTYVYADEEHTTPISLFALASTITQTTESIDARVTANELATTNAIAAEVDKRKATFGTCQTPANSATKIINDCENFELYTGAIIRVEFANANTEENPTLNINGSNIPIKSYKNENLTIEEYSWKAGAILDFIYDGHNWRLIDDGMNLRVSTAESQIKMNSDSILAIVTVDDQSSSFILTPKMIEAITNQFIVKSPDGRRTIISGGSLSTDAIQSNNYQPPTGTANSGTGTYPYSANGSLFDLGEGNIYTKNFVLDNSGGGNAYLKGTIETGAGHIGGFVITENSIYHNKREISSVDLEDDIHIISSDPYVLDEEDYLNGGYASLYEVYMGIDGISCGFGKFAVDSSGELFASNATITGNITATSLTIADGATVDGLAKSDAAWSVVISVDTINYTTNQATLAAKVYKYGDEQLSSNLGIDYSVQWYKNNVIIDGATSLILSQVTADATYTCVVS